MPRPHGYLKDAIERLKESKSEEETRVILRSFADSVESIGTLEPKNEREYIISRIAVIKSNEMFFTKSMRWNLKFNDTLVKDVDYKELNDKDLVEFFEIILRQYYKQF